MAGKDAPTERTDAPPAATAETAARPLWRRFLPVAALVAATTAVLAFDLHRFLSFEVLREHRAALLDFVAAQRLAAAAAYMALYALTIALSVPSGVILTVAGGFLFGALLGTVYTTLAATVGAAAVFLAARTAFGDALRRRAGPFVRRMEVGFREDAFSYLLILRLVPLFPFWLVNLVPAFLGVPTRTFVLATLLGIVPGTLVFSTVGAGLGSVFDRGESFSAASVLTPEVVAALVGLALLALVPVAYRRLRARRGPGG